MNANELHELAIQIETRAASYAEKRDFEDWEINADDESIKGYCRTGWVFYRLLAEAIRKENDAHEASNQGTSTTAAAVQ